MRSILFLFASAAFGQMLPGPGGNITVASSGPTLVSSSCQVLGASGGTTSPIVTGGNFIVVVASYLSSGGVINLTDNKSNGNALFGIEASGGAGNGAARIYYWESPTVGSGHTFTFTGADSALCISSWSGMAASSTLDAGTDTGTAPYGATCALPSITPSSGKKLVMSALSFNVTSTVSIDSSFTIDGQGSNVSSNFGYASAHLIQTPNGATVAPTWTNTGATSVCSIAAFKGV